MSLARENRAAIIWVRQEFTPDLSDAFPAMRKKLFVHTPLVNICLWLIFIAAAACSSDNSTQQPLQVFAATSLTSVMPVIAKAFQEEFPAAEVEFNFAASSVLAKQIAHGATADIFLSANLQWMRFLINKQRIRNDSGIEFLSNELVLITSKKRPKNVVGLQDLLNTDIQRIALADWSHVPAGIYARTALENFGIWQKISARCIPALDVRAALAYVERGDADCAIVYRTDAVISKNVIISNGLPKKIQPGIHYSGAITQDSVHPLSAVFLSFLQSKEAKVIFREGGFRHY